MFQLYYAPYACSIAPHVALREANLPFELQRVDFMRGKRLPDGSALNTVNPKGYVPALVLENGELLTEGAVILQYIADRVPELKLAPPNGTMERVRLQEWLNFIATELHKGVAPLFAKNANDEYKNATIDKVAGRLEHLEAGLADKDYLFGKQFTIADAYALYILRAWKRTTKRDLSAALNAYHTRIEQRPAVHAALEAEGIL